MKVPYKMFNTPDAYRWRPVFAFLPVKTVSGKYVWLKKIYKQYYLTTIEPPINGNNWRVVPKVEYAELLDILTEDTTDYIM